MDVEQGTVGARKAASRWLDSNPLLGRAGLGEHATLVSDHYTKERCDYVHNHSGVNDTHLSFKVDRGRPPNPIYFKGRSTFKEAAKTNFWH